MSLVIGCDTGSLGLDDIFRLVSGIDVDGNTYIRICDDETDYDDLSNIDCTDFGVSALDILRGALFLNDDGEYCLNVSSAIAGFSAEYQAVYDSLTTPPSEAIAEAQNTMVVSLVDGGIWSKLDLFYLFAQTTNGGGEALKNWINPGTFDATAIDAPTFVALEGFTGDGASDYINCNWIPNTNGVNYTLNDACVGIYSRTNIEEAAVIIGTGNGPSTDAIQIRTHHTDDKAYGRINGTSNTSPGVIDSLGMYIVIRDGAASLDLYKNGTRIGESAAGSTGMSTNDLYVLAYNNNGALAFQSTAQASCAFAGANLTPAEITNATNAIETYMDSNGKGVIP